MKRVALFGISCFLVIALNGAALSITMPSTRQPVGETFLAPIILSNFGPNGIGDYDLTVGYDSTLLAVMDIEFGSFLGGPGDSLQSTNLNAGRAEIAEVSLLGVSTLLALQPSSFTLATVEFRGLRQGIATVKLTDLVLDNAAGETLPVSGRNGTVVIGQIPEPSTIAPVAFTLAITLLMTRTGTRKVPT